MEDCMSLDRGAMKIPEGRAQIRRIHFSINQSPAAFDRTLVNRRAGKTALNPTAI
jgi:hypothetical protein